MHNDVIFPDFSAFHGTTASAQNPSPVSPAPETPGAPVPETTNRSSPETDPAAAQAANPGGAAAPGAPATSRALKGRLAAPPFSWLGGDAWPHFPACADPQA